MQEQSIEIHAPLKAVFEAYRRVERWKDWDPEVQDVSLSRGLTPGSSGWLLPSKGPKTKIKVTEVRADGFVVEGQLPLCRMLFDHVLEERPESTLVQHSVRFEGMLAPIVRGPIEKAFKDSLPVTLAGLKSYVEAGAKE